MSNISILVVNPGTKFHNSMKSIFILARMKEHSAKDISFSFKKLPNEQIQCCICGEYFTSGQKCVDHLKSSHSKICEDFVKIRTIDEKSQNILNQKEEVTRKSNRHGKHDYQTSKHINLRYHIQSVHEGLIYACDQCDYRARTKGSLKKHIQSVHEGLRFACDQCDYRATTQGHLATHIQTEHEGVRFACNQCDYQSKRQDKLTVHIQSVHEGVKYACNQCDKQFAIQSSLTRHIQSKHEGIKYTCDKCDQQFKQQSGLRTHIQSVHECFCDDL